MDIMGRMHDLAVCYARAKQNGMGGVIAEIGGCYEAASRPLPNPYTLRDCLILDAVGAREDDLVGRVVTGGNLPYFEEGTRSACWSHYGQLAQFTQAGRVSRAGQAKQWAMRCGRSAT